MGDAPVDSAGRLSVKLRPPHLVPRTKLRAAGGAKGIRLVPQAWLAPPVRPCKPCGRPRL
jgi:hypothetical protein